MTRRTSTLVALIVAAAILGGCNVKATTSTTTIPTTTTAPDTPVTLYATTVPKATTTTSEPVNLPSGDQIVGWLKDQAMPGDPMMAPLTGARWTGTELTLIYQGDSDMASQVCVFTTTNLPGNLGVTALAGVFVQRGDGKLLARTLLTDRGCKAY